MKPALAISVPDEAIARYLQTGDSDVYFSAWEGRDLFERAKRGTHELKTALVAEVRQRAASPAMPAEVRDLDVVAFTRAKLTPMVSGLFPETEREAVLRMFDRSIVFLTPNNMEQIILEAHWLSTAWNLANLYLESVDAPLLGDGAVRLVGLSEEMTCYVPMNYFTQKDRFADFVVHEAAHVFHNCKRRTLELPETRRREWLLDIAYHKRETFAYACEAYSRILLLGASRAERLRLADELAQESTPGDETVVADEYLDIVREAAAARNGWKGILARCA